MGNILCCDLDWNWRENIKSERITCNMLWQVEQWSLYSLTDFGSAPLCWICITLRKPHGKGLGSYEQNAKVFLGWGLSMERVCKKLRWFSWVQRFEFCHPCYLEVTDMFPKWYQSCTVVRVLSADHHNLSYGCWLNTFVVFGEHWFLEPDPKPFEVYSKTPIRSGSGWLPLWDSCFPLKNKTPKTSIASSS